MVEFTKRMVEVLYFYILKTETSFGVGEVGNMGVGDWDCHWVNQWMIFIKMIIMYLIESVNLSLLHCWCFFCFSRGESNTHDWIQISTHGLLIFTLNHHIPTELSNQFNLTMLPIYLSIYHHSLKLLFGDNSLVSLSAGGEFFSWILLGNSRIFQKKIQ